ncbi:MAG: hypothetical protein IT209_04380 [Armatimonadetes bacterium]|nr:hypothetical protein [Armatimonadota bacterium]
MSETPPTALLLNQLAQIKNPDARIVLHCQEGVLLARYGVALNGMHGGDSARFRFNWWEVATRRSWRLLQNTVETAVPYGGRVQCFEWSDNGEAHTRNPQARIQGQFGWGKPGVAVSMMRTLPCTLYTGEGFDISCSPIIPHDPAHLPAIWCFCSSPEYNKAVRAIDQKLNVTNATLVKVPFDLERWQKVAEERYPNGLPEPYSDDPTQWLFHGHPCGSVVWDEDAKWTAHGPLRTDATVLQVAVARLLGYRWPAEQDPEMRLAQEQRQWVQRCEELNDFADSDGIVCLPPVRGELRAADRLQSLLAAAYGQSWGLSLQDSLLTSAGASGKELHAWLRDDFFKAHCALFQNRPFIWHIWDGLRDGFSALVNYHRLDRAKLEKLAYTYLGDWISRTQEQAGQGTPGAEKRLIAARALQQKLRDILVGEKPYDIYVRWKTLAQQPMGWQPDLNDGVRLNIRPFMTADILRARPNIRWQKDRGTDPAPNCSGATERLNDLHFSLEEKRNAGNPG